MIRRRPFRPLGDIARMTLSLASDREVTCVDVARELQLSRGHASDTLCRLRASGYVVEVERRLVEGVRKPVPVVRATTEPDAPFDAILALSWPPRR